MNGIHRGTGEGRSFAFGPMRVFVKVEAAETDGAFSLVEATVPPEMPGPPRHRHPWHESLYVVSGELELVLGDDRLTVGPGEFVHAPASVPHSYGNPGSEPASAIGLFAPGEYLGAIEEIATAFPPEGGPPDMEKLQAIYRKWGQEIVP